MNLKSMKKKFGTIMALLIAVITALGGVPFEVIASQANLQNPQPILAADAEAGLQSFTAIINGEETKIPADGILAIEVEDFDEPVEVYIPRYVHFDGVRIPIDHELVESIQPMGLQPGITPFGTDSLPPATLMVSFATMPPLNQDITGVDPAFQYPGPFVQMNRPGIGWQNVQSRRYGILINGIEYEGFCADPHLPGPGHNGAVYELTNIYAPQFRTILRYGAPHNPYINSNPDSTVRSRYQYTTRIAVGMIGQPARQFRAPGGGALSTWEYYWLLNQMKAGTAYGMPGQITDVPALSVNNGQHVDGFHATGTTDTSPRMTVRYDDRRSLAGTVAVRAVWDMSITPPGTRLYNRTWEGLQFISEAPDNSNQTFTMIYEAGSGTNHYDFYIVMPAGSEGQTARVNLEGLNNAYAGRVWVAQHRDNPTGWQDIVFYIHRIEQSLSYTWETEPEEHGSLRIVKTDMQGNPLGGAVFNIDGPDPTMPRNGVVVPAGGLTINNLVPGTYTITEITPPTGFTLGSNPTQTVVVTATQPAGVNIVNAISPASGGFELPVVGATGWILSGPTAGQSHPMRSEANASAGAVQQLQPGQAFRILEESGAWWRVALNGDGAEGWVQHNYALINLPDIIPSIVYDVTNASSSVMRSSGVAIPNVTGQQLYSARTDNPRLGMAEYIVPVLFSTAAGVQTAQNNARAEGYTLIVNESFRPRQTQVRVVENLTALAASDSTVNAGINTSPWSMTWFISAHSDRVSNHQLGAGVDVALGQITEEQQHNICGMSFTRLAATPLQMPTAMHELSIAAIVYTQPNDSVFSPGMGDANSPARKLNRFMIQAGFAALSSEWWHFDHSVSVSRMQSHRNNPAAGSFFTPTIHSTSSECCDEYPGNGGNGGNGIDPGNGNNGGNGTNPGNGGDTNVTIVTFQNEPYENGYNGVTIQKICALTGATIPGAVVRLRGLDNPSIDVTQVLTAGATVAMPDGITSTVTNGVWRIEGLPPGSYEVVEVQAPDNFSMLPGPNAFAFIKEPGSTIHIMKTFRNYPFGRLELLKVEGANGIAGNRPLAGATFRLEGFYPNTPARPILRYAQTGSDGRIVFDDLPAGQFTLTEVMPPTGYTFGSVRTWSVNIGWGQVYSIIAYNVPKSNLTVYKACSNTGAMLNGATFELRDPTTGESWIGTTANGSTTFGVGTYGNYLYPGRTYILTEVRSPAGYVILAGLWDVVLSPGANSIRIYNTPYGEIVIYKRDYANGTGSGRFLPGATFLIQGTYLGTTPPTIIDRTAVTDANGRIQMALPGGTFTVTEIDPPSGFMLSNNNVWTVTVVPGQTIAAGTAPTHTFFNEQKSSLEILKICGVTGEPLESAIFEIYDPATGERWQATSAANGIALLGRGTYGNFLYPGRTYIVREIRAPYGFVLQAGPREVILSPGDENRIVWENFRNPGLTIIKECQDTGERLAGAHFTVVAQGSGRPLPIDFPMITDENGEIFIPWTLFSGEAERNFIVTETVAPPGFHLANPNWQLVTMQAGYPNTVVFSNRRMPDLTIQKRDAITGEPIQNAEFTIERLSPAPTGMLTGNPFRTNARGEIIVPNLTAGVYRIIETRAAPNYWLDPHEANRTWIIEIRENEDYFLVVENTLLPTLVITKFNHMTHRPVPMTHFMICFEVPNSGNEQCLGRHITNANGQIIIPFVGVGWYRIQEVMPAPGMSLNVNNHYRVFLGPGANTYQLGLHSRPETAQEDIEFRIAPPSDGDIVISIDEDAPEPEQLEPIEEPATSAPPNDQPYTHEELERMTETQRIQAISGSVQVTGGGNWVVGEGIWNWPLNSIIIKKTCSVTGNLLQGATFELIHTSAGVSGTLGTVIGRYTTDNSGVIVITGLIPGSYAVREVQAPNNFTLSETNTQHVFLQPDGHSIVEVVFANDPYGSLLITKRCEVTGRPLQNAEFRVTTSNGSVVGTSNGVFRTNQQGEILIPNLRPDSYMVTEILAPAGFEIDRSTHTIRVNATGQIYRVDVTNRPLSSLIIRKLDSYDGTPLAGARFEVRRQNGEMIGEFVTDQHGSIEITGVLGWFVVHEVEAPPGFALDVSAMRTVEVRPQTPTIVTFYNPRNGSLAIEKTDPSGAPLAGAQFRVSRQNGELVGTFTTPVSGIITVPNLTAGWYFVEETRAPAGFIISQAGQSVEVRPNTAALVTFVNYRQPSIVIEKVDESGNPLAGAVFEVRTLAGARVATATTDNGGTATVTGLSPGAFQVVETRAPAGFVLDSNAQIVEVAGGDIATVRFINRRVPSLIIEKVDELGNPLAGAEFEVRTLGGNLVSRVTTNIGGIVTTESIEPGSYSVTEVRAPQGFVLDANAQTFEIRVGETTTLRFVNRRHPSLIIEKVDEQGNPLAGAEFEVRTLGGNLVSRVTTNSGGIATIESIEPGSYSVTEVRAPQGFVLDANAQTFEIRAGETTTLRFVNRRIPSLIIEKVDEQGNPLAGAEFEIRRLDGGLVTRVTSNSGGVAIVDSIEPGSFEVLETHAPEGFVRDSNSQVIQVVAGQTVTLRFVNVRIAETSIRKISGETGLPLAGVVFEITGLNGERIRNPINRTYEFVTDSAGMIHLPFLVAGAYVATETRPLPGYFPAPPQTFEVANGANSTILFRNYKRPSFVIRKICGDTGTPLAGVEFEIARYFGNGRTGQRLKNYAVDSSYTFATDRSGHIYLPSIEDGVYVAIETRPLPGFMMGEPTIFTVGQNGDTTVIIRNYRYPDFALLKLDGNSRQPLQGVHFEIAHDIGNGQAGQRLVNPADGTTTFITDNAGRIPLPSIAPGRYIAIETRALPGYTIEGPTLFTVEAGQNRTITIYNFKRADWVIRKRDGDTNEPLSGVHFEIARYFGNGNAGERLRNPVDGSNTFITDNAGLIQLPNLEAGTFIAIETRALPGYIVAEPRIFVVEEGAQNTTIDIYNFSRPNLTIRKINSVTRQSIEGVAFEISRLDGQRIRNPQTGFFEFLTDRNGLIHLPDIEDGTFIVTETRPAPGFIGLIDPIMLEINATTRQREYLLVVENDPASGLLIIKTCAQTNEPLQGVEFEIRHADGRLVTGQILDQNQPNTHANSPQLGVNGNGRFLTDAQGRIQLNHLPPGVYHITETRALQGYQLDSTVHVVTVLPGQQAVLEVENAPLAGFRLLKICAVTRNPIFNVEFMVFDANNQVVGVFYTDNTGIIDFSAILAPGRYTIRETRPAPGFSRDDMPRTVEFIAGRVLEIVWENVPMAGQLQILKLSGDANYHNGLPAGTPLEGAIFEIFEARTGNLVDRIVSNDRGMAVSRPLPLGRYIAVEVAAPMFYMVNPQEIHFEIEFEGQIVRTTFPNFSANMGVTIRKTGPQEAMQGHSIRYDIPIIRNDSTVPLADFFWRDILPVNAVRVDRLVTGTFNHSLRYRIIATTNRGNEIVVADNLSTTRNNVIELRPVHLGLAADEFIVEFIVHFGQVPAGFTSVERPRVYVDVLPAHIAHLPNGMMFANRVDAGGRVIGTDEWIIGGDSTATTVFNPNRPPNRIPQSGF